MHLRRRLDCRRYNLYRAAGYVVSEYGSRLFTTIPQRTRYLALNRGGDRVAHSSCIHVRDMISRLDFGIV